MPYTILTNAVERSRFSLVDNAFVHLSDGSAVWLALNTTSGKIGLWHTPDRSTSATEIHADIALNAETVSATTHRHNPGRYNLARDNADNLYVFDSLSAGKVRAYAKGSGYSWTARAVLTPSASTFGSTGDMVWCDTGGGTNGAGHLLFVGWNMGVSPTGPQVWRTIDAGVLLVGSGTPGGTSGTGTAGPFGSFEQLTWNEAGNLAYPNAQLAADGFGATTGVAMGIAKTASANSYPLPVGSWSVASTGTPTFTHIASLATMPQFSLDQPARIRLIRTSADRFAALYSPSATLQTAVMVSRTAVLSAARPTPDTQITNWPYPNMHQEWDAGLDETRGKLWLYAAGRGASTALYRMGATVSGTTIIWDSAVTVENASWGSVSSDAKRARVRAAQRRVSSIQDYQVDRGLSVSNLYGVDGSASVYNQAPYAPILVAPTSGDIINLTVDQTFDWDFSDPDPGDSQSKYDLRYRVVGVPSWTDLSATTTATLRTISANTFTAGDYEWQVRTYDSTGTVGPYSASSFFTAAAPPSGHTITAPANNATISSDSTTMTWSAPDQDAYEVRKVADNAGVADPNTVYFTTGTVESPSSRSRVVTFPVNGRAEHLQLRIRHQTLWSTWASVKVTINYNPPATPTLEVYVYPRLLLVVPAHPAPGAGQPTVTSIDIFRRPAGTTGEGIRIAAGAPKTAWYSDYKIGHREEVEYLVRANGDNGTTADSVWVG